MQQTNSYDCGLFTIQNGLAAISGRPRDELGREQVIKCLTKLEYQPPTWNYDSHQHVPQALTDSEISDTLDETDKTTASDLTKPWIPLTTYSQDTSVGNCLEEPVTQSTTSTSIAPEAVLFHNSSNQPASKPEGCETGPCSLSSHNSLDQKHLKGPIV